MGRSSRPEAMSENVAWVFVRLEDLWRALDKVSAEEEKAALAAGELLHLMECTLSMIWAKFCQSAPTPQAPSVFQRRRSALLAQGMDSAETQHMERELRANLAAVQLAASSLRTRTLHTEAASVDDAHLQTLWYNLELAEAATRAISDTERDATAEAWRSTCAASKALAAANEYLHDHGTHHASPLHAEWETGLRDAFTVDESSNVMPKLSVTLAALQARAPYFNAEGQEALDVARLSVDQARSCMSQMQKRKQLALLQANDAVFVAGVALQEASRTCRGTDPVAPNTKQSGSETDEGRADNSWSSGRKSPALRALSVRACRLETALQELRAGPASHRPEVARALEVAGFTLTQLKQSLRTIEAASQDDALTVATTAITSFRSVELAIGMAAAKHEQAVRRQQLPEGAMPAMEVAGWNV